MISVPDTAERGVKQARFCIDNVLFTFPDMARWDIDVQLSHTSWKLPFGTERMRTYRIRAEMCKTFSICVRARFLINICLIRAYNSGIFRSYFVSGIFFDRPRSYERYRYRLFEFPHFCILFT